ncbi:aminotransferase class I/II-fold pyridoxal phosphate-dependent enzyme [Pedobacter montanisoli]|uniref:Pyridoxal phosphate-dependent aminotransferase family protein n=1 Tax=Pedobacter montanisoli TaxID=2923277 RepID=A0ABS9ZXW4_9SPHI|nr:pyridoxal phosphate-dependent aminotransferase family protein [Pedobacter montanisoli]MCJ0743135.1 pyridoxal phosphate-dependent aminotransferase family protein [Pedobacter montanisoli]
MKKAEDFLIKKLEERKQSHNLRCLSVSNPNLIDFCSNDYLGFAKSSLLKDKIEALEQQKGIAENGSGGSRLLTGNRKFTEETENFIARFHETESALIFNSGYDANLGLLSSLGQRGDTIIYDELTHASLIDGARLSFADRLKFKHNNIHDLELKLQKAKGTIYVVIESIYSMDGDMAPLESIYETCEKYGAHLIVDEAHAIGVFGDYGRGLVHQNGLNDKIFACVVTFGKALGCHGAAVLGSLNLRNYLINFARSFIYTTAMPLHGIMSIRAAYALLTEQNYQQNLYQNIALYRKLTSTLKGSCIDSLSAIQTIILGSAEKARGMALYLQEAGYDVRAILSPTVSKGTERLRICLHSFNTPEAIEGLISKLKSHE